jgi:hypothetical protein
MLRLDARPEPLDVDPRRVTVIGVATFVRQTQPV